jgi:hypothetical protein
LKDPKTTPAKTAPGKKAPDKVDLTGWNYVCAYGTYRIYAKGDKRRIVDDNIGNIIMEYKIGIYGVELE